MRKDELVSTVKRLGKEEKGRGRGEGERGELVHVQGGGVVSRQWPINIRVKQTFF